MGTQVYVALLGVVNAFPAERAVFLRETQDKLYHPAAFYLAKVFIAFCFRDRSVLYLLFFQGNPNGLEKRCSLNWEQCTYIYNYNNYNIYMFITLIAVYIYIISI